jgi:hypothetical protein
MWALLGVSREVFGVWELGDLKMGVEGIPLLQPLPQPSYRRIFRFCVCWRTIGPALFVLLMSCKALRSAHECPSRDSEQAPEQNSHRQPWRDCVPYHADRPPHGHPHRGRLLGCRRQGHACRDGEPPPPPQTHTHTHTHSRVSHLLTILSNRKCVCVQCKRSLSLPWNQ